ncbi:MAG: helix-turn-helix domain-containing protein [Treponema sp.]|jgi:transposase|nr:helix-turn-helix domain-containing protein [Treponema sp.]
MRKKTYPVHLTSEEERQLKDIVDGGVHPARQVRRARILLLLNEGTDGAGLKVPEQRKIAELCQCHTDVVYKVGRQYVEKGLERVLNRKKRETPPVLPKVTGDIEAKILALSSSEPPAGYSRWTLRLLEERSKDLLGIELSDTTIRKVLKKNTPALGL